MTPRRHRRTYATYDQAAVALTTYLGTRLGRVHRWWLARRGRALVVITCPSTCGCWRFRIEARADTSAAWGLR